MKCEQDCECIKCTHFSYTSSIYGLKDGEFSDLPQKIKNKLLRLMARIMERAYRRGVQQAMEMEPTVEIGDLHAYRYENSLDDSLGLDGFRSSSLERLAMEESLDEVGLIGVYDEN